MGSVVCGTFPIQPYDQRCCCRMHPGRPRTWRRQHSTHAQNRDSRLRQRGGLSVVTRDGARPGGTSVGFRALGATASCRGRSSRTAVPGGCRTSGAEVRPRSGCTHGVDPCSPAAGRACIPPTAAGCRSSARSRCRSPAPGVGQGHACRQSLRCRSGPQRAARVPLPPATRRPQLPACPDSVHHLADLESFPVPHQVADLGRVLVHAHPRWMTLASRSATSMRTRPRVRCSEGDPVSAPRDGRTIPAPVSASRRPSAASTASVVSCSCAVTMN